MGLWKSTTPENVLNHRHSQPDLEIHDYEDKFDERLEEEYYKNCIHSASSSFSHIPGSHEKHVKDDGQSDKDNTSVQTHIPDTTKSGSILTRENSACSTIVGSTLSRRMDSSETLKDITPMLLEASESFHSWEDAEGDPHYLRDPYSSNEDKVERSISINTSISFQNTSSNSISLPCNGWQSSCDTTAHERQLSDLSKISQLQSVTVEPSDGNHESQRDNQSSRNTSVIHQSVHRRQSSVGSRVSFHEVVQYEYDGSASQLIGYSIDHRPCSFVGTDISESIDVHCAQCNIQALKKIRKLDARDLHRARKSLRKIRPLAMQG